MAGYFPSIPARSSLAKAKLRLLFWIAIGLVLFVMIVLGLVFGLVLGFAHKGGADSVIGQTVTLDYSTFKGVDSGNGVTHWWGIRYAAPPVGDLRFRAPQDPLKNETIQDASQHGALCRFSPSNSVGPGHSEDCLFLDIYAPTSNKGNHPVYVFVQGGGLNTLSSANMNGENLIAGGDHDMIVITFNYRVGPYGFLASKEVKANGDLNTGLLDQKKLLQWVKKYIKEFGGDPNRVTLGGASAGAGAVELHLTSYGGRDDGLFHAATMESPSFGAQLTIDEAQYQYDALVKRVKCDTAQDTLKCLRDTAPNVIPQNKPDLPTPGGAGGKPVFMWSAVVDGDFIEDHSYTMFTNGKFIKLPIISGGDTNEGTIFTPTKMDNYTQVNNFLKNNFPLLDASQLAAIDHLYPQAEQFPGRAPYWRTAANAYGEMRYSCPSIYISSQFDAQGVQNNFNYNWDVLNQANAKNGLGVTHTAEAAAIWGNAAPTEANLTPIIQSYWTSFIRTAGDPNKYKNSSAPEWTRFDNNGMQRIRFENNDTKTGMESVDAGQQARCKYLSSIGGAIGQ